MSEEIKITVAIKNENSTFRENKKGEKERTVFLTQAPSATLMPVLLENRLMNSSLCGGRGDCGRCVVQFLEGAPLPTGIERARLTPEELRQGYRLACVARPKRDCTIRIVNGEDVETPIVTEVNLPSDNSDRENKNLKNERYIIAVDLGTTTIAMQLRDVATGETADTYCEKNPQRIYGSDVLARIEASCSGKRKELQRLVCESLARGLRQFCAYLGQKADTGRDGGRNRNGPPAGKKAEERTQIVCMCIAGNTTMAHLLMGYDVTSLGRAPFVPVETGVQRIAASDLFFEMEASCGEFPVYIAPCISAFVGGDIVAGLYALGMLPGLSPGEGPGKGGAEVLSDAAHREREQTQTALLIDLGTNGEMAMMKGCRMVVTATAAGPAFEGCGDLVGTDRIALTADLLQRGVLDETGLLAEPCFDEGVLVEATGEAGTNRKKSGCYFKQEDIRALQMAKAAVRAGVEILWEKMGSPQTDRIYLAGGFGYFLDVEAAIAIGLLPSHMRGRVQAVGNTSLAGAYALGRDLLTGKIKEGMLEKRLAEIESINLAEAETFEALYLKYMNLEEN